MVVLMIIPPFPIPGTTHPGIQKFLIENKQRPRCFDKSFKFQSIQITKTSLLPPSIPPTPMEFFYTLSPVIHIKLPLGRKATFFRSRKKEPAHKAQSKISHSRPTVLICILLWCPVPHPMVLICIS
ncbi:hypothetical protein CEXT_317161 [Caerostris extrusa]|uniref:Uncharacterized protein n=1 Tax=Caerostris extrusa TaxID=172846 RepID=A0AAV4TCR6_CAEEX|nr:hypothetical protein CEXT_317161 [Caerostris extrusa]